MAVPIGLGVVVIPSMELTEPLVGWRMKQDETAEAFDAFLLASTTAGPSNLPEAVRHNLTANLERRRRLSAA